MYHTHSSDEKDAYLLRHWQLESTLDGVSVKGHLHGREGFPDGVLISTSSVISWNNIREGVIFRTENSRYFCPHSDYTGELNCLTLAGFEKILAQVNDARKKRVQYYRSFAGILPERNALILNWYGTDSPYLRWAAYIADEKIVIDDTPQLANNTPVRISMETKACPSVCFSLQKAVAFPVSGEKVSRTAVFLENSGSKAIEFSGTGKAGIILLKPGKIQRIGN